jgi:hypothetical protein
VWRPGDQRQWWPRYDVDRPHVRLGLLWALGLLVALLIGRWGLALLFAPVAAVGALQTAKAWQRVDRRPAELTAGAVAAALPLGAALADWGLGAAVLIGVGASVVTVRGSAMHMVGDAGVTIRCWVFIGLAAAAPVAVYRFDVGAAVALVVLVSAYDSGFYLFGAGARWPAVGGVIGGGLGVAVLSFTLFAVGVGPFDGAEIYLFAAITVVTASLGQVAASAVLPDGRALASGLRRLDSLLITGPVWLVLLHQYY